MKESVALNQMVLPKDNRRGKPLGGVLQIWVTRLCDKSCFNCTQGSNLRNPQKYQMSVENFTLACKSLKKYFGVVGLIGGNPALHKEFPTLCNILRDMIPKERCGLWCNKLFGNGHHARITFNPAISNLNVHLDEGAYKEFRTTWPESRPFGLTEESRHSPVYVSMQDIIKDEEKRWELISKCDINKHWSAMIGEFRGELRGYFCEIAASQAMLNQDNPDYPDTGIKITEDNLDWWKGGVEDFENQIKYHCHRCGVPMRGEGSLAQDSNGKAEEVTSKEYVDLYIPKTKGREVKVVETLGELKAQGVGRMTNYMQNAKD